MAFLSDEATIETEKSAKIRYIRVIRVPYKSASKIKNSLIQNTRIAQHQITFFPDFREFLKPKRS